MRSFHFIAILSVMTFQAAAQASQLRAEALASSLPKLNIDLRFTGQLPTAPAGIEGETFIFARSEDGTQLSLGQGSFATEWELSSISMTTLTISIENFLFGHSEYSPSNELWCEKLSQTILEGLNAAKAAKPEQDREAAEEWSRALHELEKKNCLVGRFLRN